jgi:hypothetical protein
MSKPRLTFDELISLTDEAAAVVGAIHSIIATAKEAAEDGEVSAQDVQAIEAQVQSGIDALQALAAEVVKQAVD